MYYIGIDLGTSSVKLLMMDADGSVKKIVSKEYPLYFPNPGWSEQSPEDWYRETINGLKEILDGEDKSKLGGISFGGQMHGLVALDKDDKVIRRAILWNDGRSIKECEYLNETVGRDVLSKNTANVAFAGFTAPKVMWMKENEPENYAKIRKIMLPKDYLTYMLTGEHATDVSDASGMLLLDVKNRKWSEEMCKICGVDMAWLPKLYESYEAVGTVKESVAKELGIGNNVIVAAGAGDNAAAAVATGTVGEAKCNTSLGTSGTIFLSQKNFRVDPNNGLHSFCDANGEYHLLACMLSAASCNKWWMEDILKTTDFDNEQAYDKKLGTNHVFYLPYLMGERSPINNPLARATFTGMTMDTTRKDMTLAVLEGVTFALRDSLEVARSIGFNVERTKIVGGGAKSPLWRELVANIFGIPVDIAATEEGPSHGAAMLAAVACGEYKSVEEAAEKIVKVVYTLEPNKELTARYDEKYAQFKQIYPALKNVFPAIQ
ncbi:MAG: xylulokinase [Eubacterium sp.]|nr:xylulokinase [Eubacterium sp.]